MTGLRRALAVAAVVVPGLFARCEARLPNIIFIMADDLGIGDAGCYGGDKILTPSIDRLAREGTRFTQVYAGSPVCAPSRCVLMTGLHTGHCLIRDNNPDVGGEPESFGEGGIRLSMTGREATVASLLREAGYATGIAGKWGIGEPGSGGTPNRMGFDEWLGYLNQNHAAYYYTDFLWRDGEKMPVNQESGRGVYSNDLFRDFALEFVRSRRDRPFFLYLPFTIPHARMEVPSLGAYAERDWPEEAKIYAAMVSRLDAYVGDLLGELERLDLVDDTAVFFTSDNGPVKGDRTRFLGSSGRRRGAKGTLYEGGINVPMIVRWPGRIPAGRVSAVSWGFVDVLPTLLDLAGRRVPAGLDGVSAMPALKGTGQDLAERLLYWEFPRERLWQAARLGRWKAVRFGSDQPVELYDLASDPAEERNVAATNPAVAGDLARLMDESHIRSPHWPVD